MTVKEKRGVYPVYCGDCGKYLADVPKSTATKCNVCNRWTKLEPGQKPEAEANRNITQQVRARAERCNTC